MSKFLIILPILVLLFSCNAQPPKTELENFLAKDTVVHEPSEIEVLYSQYQNDSISISKGTVSNGELHNGALIPFSGSNYLYFDTNSYIAKRAFVNTKVKQAILQTYDSLDNCSETFFGIMECSNEHGGKLYPHKTHQNGLSVDFMVPLLKNGKASTELNNLGAQHYFMDFDDNGVYEENSDFQIDFNTIALHLLILMDKAKDNGLEIDKVILKIGLKDNLFATPNGKKLKASGVYFAEKLTPLIDNLHDDHYHVDFKIR